MLVVKVGPIKSKYRGEVYLKNIDEEKQVIEIEGKGTDVKGKGGANMELNGSITAKEDGLTEVVGDSTVQSRECWPVWVANGGRCIQSIISSVYKALSAKLEGSQSSEDINSEVDNSLSGVAVASALKGVSGRLMDKLKGKKITKVKPFMVFDWIKRASELKKKGRPFAIATVINTVAPTSENNVKSNHS